MRAFLWGSIASVVAGFILRAAADSELSRGELARWHFLGTSRVAADTNGARVHAVFAQPSTKALLGRAFDGLSRRSTSDPAGAALVRDFLEQALAVESRGECHAEPGEPVQQWIVALRTGGSQAQQWATRWAELARHTGFAQSSSAVEGEWFLGGLGRTAAPDLKPLQKEAVGGTLETSVPVWLELDADLARLAKMFSWPACIIWPRAHLTLTGRGPNVRTTADLVYAEPLALSLGQWQVPTNTVREPLLSFTALQGIGPWLAKQPALKELGWPAPNQLFGWAQSESPYATHAAWQMPDAPARIQAAQANLKAVARSLVPWLDLGELEYVAEASRLTWRGFPILVPFIGPAADTGFVQAGLFPVANPKQPAPPELYAQLWGRTNLVYYNWELTQPRLGDWEALDVLFTITGGFMPPPTNSVARTWLRDTNVTSQLGNCVTEITAEGPERLRVVRTSAAGLTAFELFRAALWIEGERFPGYTPPQPVQLRRKQAAEGKPSKP